MKLYKKVIKQQGEKMANDIHTKAFNVAFKLEDDPILNIELNFDTIKSEIIQACINKLKKLKSI